VRRQHHGFTVIELLVVLAAVALLLSIAAPRYVQHLDHAREVALKQNLWQLRDVMEKFYADHGRYPEALQELVAKRYLRAVPVDPLTQRDDTWQLAKPGNPLEVRAGDVRSGAPGTSREGTPYATW
jgi:general secretion pathway protein G